MLNYIQLFTAALNAEPPKHNKEQNQKKSSILTGIKYIYKKLSGR
jgi:molecular chaperone GrpE (heat shock protein)